MDDSGADDVAAPRDARMRGSPHGLPVGAALGRYGSRMNWWNDLIDWTASDAGWRVLSGAVIPFVAIVVAGVVAALIGRGATKRVVSLQEREARNSAVAAIISAARKAAVWGSLGHDERAYADHLAEDADVRLRLLPVSGAPTAANWAQHEIADIKKNSSTFSFQRSSRSPSSATGCSSGRHARTAPASCSRATSSGGSSRARTPTPSS